MKKNKNALISVFNKDHLDDISKYLIKNKYTIYSTGGSSKYLKKIGLDENYKIQIVNSTDKEKREKYVKHLYKKLQREGVFKEMKQRRAYEKPSEKKARLLNESTRRCKKILRKKLEIQGY